MTNDLRARLLALADDPRYARTVLDCNPPIYIADPARVALAAARLALEEAAETCICHGMEPTATQADRRLCAATLIRALAASLGDGP